MKISKKEMILLSELNNQTNRLPSPNPFEREIQMD
jgi:hypothetical protein